MYYFTLFSIAWLAIEAKSQKLNSEPISVHKRDNHASKMDPMVPMISDYKSLQMPVQQTPISTSSTSASVSSAPASETSVPNSPAASDGSFRMVAYGSKRYKCRRRSPSAYSSLPSTPVNGQQSTFPGSSEPARRQSAYSVPYDQSRAIPIPGDQTAPSMVIPSDAISLRAVAPIPTMPPGGAAAYASAIAQGPSPTPMGMPSAGKAPVVAANPTLPESSLPQGPIPPFEAQISSANQPLATALPLPAYPVKSRVDGLPTATGSGCTCSGSPQVPPIPQIPQIPEIPASDPAPNVPLPQGQEGAPATRAPSPLPNVLPLPSYPPKGPPTDASLPAELPTTQSPPDLPAKPCNHPTPPVAPQRADNESPTTKVAQEVSQEAALTKILTMIEDLNTALDAVNVE